MHTRAYGIEWGTLLSAMWMGGAFIKERKCVYKWVIHYTLQQKLVTML